MRRAVAIIVLATLAIAPVAQAKGTAQICGAGGCTTVTDPGVVGPLRSTFGPARAPNPAPFYVVRFCSGADCRGSVEWSYLYVPSAKLMRGSHIGAGPVHWMQASLLSALLADLTKRLEPYAVSRSWTPTLSRPGAASRGDQIPIGPLAVAALAAMLGIALWRARRVVPGRVIRR